MPVVAVVLLTLAFWGIYWFVRMGGIDHFRAKSAQRKDEARKALARDLEWTGPLRAVDDPRDAATVLMLLIPRGGDPTQPQIAAIEDNLRSVFGFDQELTERLTQARFIAARADGFEQAGKLFSDLLKKRLTAEEKQQLIGMVEDVARLDGPSQTQTAAIATLAQRIGLAPAA
jgi:uncharacterized tellurite resistance protein B-like protein